MRIVCISDTHSLHKGMLYDLPQGDILIHSGDCTNIGQQNDVRDFIDWFQKIEGFVYKIFIAGNHDFAFETEPRWLNLYMDPLILSEHNVTYLEDSGFEIISSEFSRPIKIYGSPWQPEFFDWAFNLPRMGDVLNSKWDDIPNDTNILITHGPPHGIRDFTPTNLQVGCELLRNRVFEIKPSLHVFGHIHGAYGTVEMNDTVFANASTCNERYQPINKPLVFDLTETDGVFNIEFVQD